MNRLTVADGYTNFSSTNSWVSGASNPIFSITFAFEPINYYLAEVASASDYYPFGIMIAERTFSSGSYRYGFNGKENDNEVKGAGNQQDYGMRIYDGRLGRFLSVDPLSKTFPYWSPYLFAGNTPILYVDYNGSGIGTHFIFFEGAIAVGIGAAGAYIEQCGIAYDRAGKTHFVVTNELKVVNQGLEREGVSPNLYVGAEAGLAAGYKYDKRSTFLEATSGGNAASSSFEIRGKFGVGGEISNNSLGVTLGISAGAGILYASDNVKFSVSVSDKEAKIVSDATDVWNESWLVRNSKPTVNADGEISGYEGSLMTKDGNGKIIETGIKVFSGVSQDADGNSSSNNIWMSKDYEKAAQAPEPE